MNKKQLMVAWLMGLLICTFLVIAPTAYIIPQPLIGTLKTSKLYENKIIKIQWDFVLQRSLIVLIIGGLLTYSLRDHNR